VVVWGALGCSVFGVCWSADSYGKVKLVLKHKRFWVETSDMEVRKVRLLQLSGPGPGFQGK
jgi:hypothetical protein